MSVPVKATCHCGAVELRIRLTARLETARRCDCSFCRRRAAPNVSVPLDGLELVRGAEALSLYTWGTGTAKHYFCSVCGCYTHHQRRSKPDEYGVNLGAIEGVNPADYEPIAWNDGVNYALNATAE